MLKKYKSIILSVSLLPSMVLGNLFSAFSTEQNVLEVDLIITEVMSNPLNEDCDEFIEVLNTGEEVIDITKLFFTDGDALDEIVPWNKDQGSGLKPLERAVILDSEYNEGDMPYQFSDDVLLFTTKDTTLGNGLTQTDSITFFYGGSSRENVLDTYGTPEDEENWRDRDDDELDSIPQSAENGFSIERIDEIAGDNEDNWSQSREVGGTPGFENSVQENHPPTVEIDGPEEAEQGEIIYFYAEIYDQDEDALSIWWDMGDGVSYESVEVEHIYQESGEYAIQVRVTDGFEEVAVEVVINVVGIEEEADYSNLILSEIFPNPAGSDDNEFIEIQNKGKTSINIDGIGIKDGTQRIFWVSFENSKNSELKPGEYRVFPRSQTKIALNNSGEEYVSIVDSQNQIIDYTLYQGADENQSFSRLNDEWLWTESVTPGEENKYTVSPDKVPEDENEVTDPEVDEAQDNEDLDEPKEDTEEEEELAVYQLSDEIVINELIPNPEGSDEENEWIEIFNSGSDLNLVGWKIADQSTEYTFANEDNIYTNEHKVVSRDQTKIALNNSGDTIRLIDPEGKIVDEISYQGAVEGESWARNTEDSWEWTIAQTPGVENSIQKDLLEEFSENDEKTDKNISDNSKTESEQNTSQQEGEQLPRTVIENLYSMQKGKEVRILGVVIAEPGVFEEKSCYIQDETRGIKVYFGKEDWPEMQEGEVWEFVGKVSEANGEKKINIASAEGIKKVKEVLEIFTVDISKQQKNSWETGSLVKVSGTIVKSTKTQSTLMTDAGEELDIKWKAEDIQNQVWNQEVEVEMLAILRETKTDPYLLPRKNSDIKLKEQNSLNSIEGDQEDSQEHVINDDIDDQGDNKVIPDDLKEDFMDFGVPIALGYTGIGAIMGTGVMFADRKWAFVKRIQNYIKDLQDK